MNESYEEKIKRLRPIDDDFFKIYIHPIEIVKDRAIPKRASLHMASLTSFITYPGQLYDNLQKRYVVFITEESVLDDETFVHQIERRSKETGEVFEDNEKILYINCSKHDESELGKVMHDMLCTNEEDMYHPILKERARYFKETEEGKRIMCEIWDEVRNEGRAEGRIEQT